MNQIVEPTINNLLKTVKHQAYEEGVVSFDEYQELVDDLINEKVTWGELNSAEDIEQMKEKLLSRWEEVNNFVYRKTTDML